MLCQECILKLVNLCQHSAWQIRGEEDGESGTEVWQVGVRNQGLIHVPAVSGALLGFTHVR